MNEEKDTLSNMMDVISFASKQFALALTETHQTEIATLVSTEGGQWEISAKFTPSVQ